MVVKSRRRRNYVSWCCRIMYHQFSLSVSHSPATSDMSLLTHTSEWIENYFNLTSIMTERSKILFQTNPDSYYIFALILLGLSRSGHLHVYEFCVLSPHIFHPLTHLSLSLSISIDQRLMLTTRLTYVRFIYAARKKNSSFVWVNEIFHFFASSFVSINNITSLIPFLIRIFNTHNLPIYNSESFRDLCFFYFFLFLPVAAVINTSSQKRVTTRYIKETQKKADAFRAFLPSSFLPHQNKRSWLRHDTLRKGFVFVFKLFFFDKI